MGRILALDYGLRRSGLAATDELRIIAAPLTTVDTPKLLDFLVKYCQTQPVDVLLIGEAPLRDGQENPLETPIRALVKSFSKAHPNVEIVRYDEHLTSRRASEVIRQTVAKKSKRQDKSLVDQVSAAILLQDYLGHSI